MTPWLLNLDVKWFKAIYKLALWGLIGLLVAIMQRNDFFYYGTAENIMGTINGIYMKSSVVLIVVIFITGIISLFAPKNLTVRTFSLDEISTNVQSLVSFFWCQAIYFISNSYHAGATDALKGMWRETLYHAIMFAISVLLLQFLVTKFQPSSQK
ncbi:hypothetical protein [Gluconacetobacter johannae]|uniref:Uncharacterized protein n=1 Tax=Gluconacetobacter johannae TaxID=112140 RepID=A0A7W4J900_9PROT|nr:hypothetical protein [Gluconacetobacter johannae]MBB2176672.1 hypothetical protein [Gluconacetobacter johannae]